GEEGGEAGRPPIRARDGWVVIMSAGPAMTRRMFEAMGLPPTEGDLLPGGGRRTLHQAVGDWCAAHTVEEICDTLVRIGVPVAPVLNPPQVAADPHLRQREMLVKMEDPLAGELYLPGLTIKLSETPGKLGPVPPPPPPPPRRPPHAPPPPPPPPPRGPPPRGGVGGREGEGLSPSPTPPPPPPAQNFFCEKIPRGPPGPAPASVAQR